MLLRLSRDLQVRGHIVGQLVSTVVDQQCCELVRAILSAPGVNVAHCDQLLALLAWAPPNLRRRIQRYALQDRGARLPIRGDDLVAIGLRGPAVGRALARIRVAFLDRAVRNREEALALAREIARRGGRRRNRSGDE